MTYQQYREILQYELYRLTWNNPPFLQRLRIKYLQPNTNCMYLARKMWFFYQQGFVGKCIAKLLYLKILHKYSCIIYPNAQVDRGFFISHPVGIVLGKCKIGENFMLYHGCTIDVRKYGEEALNLIPQIGNNVTLYTGSIIAGNISIGDNITIGANSVILQDLQEPGVYAGTPKALKYKPYK